MEGVARSTILHTVLEVTKILCFNRSDKDSFAWAASTSISCGPSSRWSSCAPALLDVPTKSPGDCRGFCCSPERLLQRLEPIVDILVNLVLGVAVALLQFAFELIPPAFDHVEIVIGELAPFFLGGTLELFPVTFDPVPIHRHLLLCWD